MSVKPFRLEAFTINSINVIEKVTDKDQTETTELTRALISFKAKDVYGNFMIEDQICSLYAHPRFLVYFNFILQNPVPSNQLKSV